MTLAWLRAGEGEGHFHDPGASQFGITAYAGREENDLILWLPSTKAIVTCDSLSDFGDGLDIQFGGRKHATREDRVQRLRSLLDLPIEQLVLPRPWRTENRAAMEQVLAASSSQSSGPNRGRLTLAAKDRKLGMEHEDLKVVLRLVAATEEHAELKRVTDNEV